jgi:beta-glucosidase
VQGGDLNHLRAVATSKHFAVHSGPEQLRHGFNVDPSPRDLEETYLPAFRATVTEGHVQSVMCAYNSIDEFPGLHQQDAAQGAPARGLGLQRLRRLRLRRHCGRQQGPQERPRTLPTPPCSRLRPARISRAASGPRASTHWPARSRQGLISEDLVTQAAERLYTARFQLGLFDPQGSSPLDNLSFSDDLLKRDRPAALKAAEESIVLLKNNGACRSKLRRHTLPSSVPRPTCCRPSWATMWARLLPDYAAGRHLASSSAVRPSSMRRARRLPLGVGVPVPRTAFSLSQGLKTEFFATPDWTGRPVATLTQPAIQTDWENAEPVPQLATHDYSVRWTGTLAVPAPGHYVFTLEQGDSFPYSPVETYRFILDGKVLSEGSLREGTDLSVMGNFGTSPGASPTAPPIEHFSKKSSIVVDFADIKPHDFRLEYSHAGDASGGGLTLKWEAPAQAQLDEAVARAKEADVVVAFVGLSPQLEGEEMKIKIDGFEGGDRTSLELPAPQQKLLEAVAATGKPLIVVLQSGSAVALNWANEHADAVLEAWYPGVAGGEAIARTLAGLNNPAGRLPVTFYASLDNLPAFTDYTLKGRTYRYFTGKPLWGFGYGLSYSTFKYGPIKLSAEILKAGEPLTATVTVTNTSTIAGDEVVEAYLKTPQPDGPIRSLAGFQRVRVPAGVTRAVSISIDPRALSSVDDKGNRAILPGKYVLTLGGAQPQDTSAKSEAGFTITGSLDLPK